MLPKIMDHRPWLIVQRFRLCDGQVSAPAPDAVVPEVPEAVDTSPAMPPRDLVPHLGELLNCLKMALTEFAGIFDFLF